MDEKKIKRKVNYYVKKYGTTDPYKLAKSLKVEYFFILLEKYGECICISKDINVYL